MSESLNVKQEISRIKNIVDVNQKFIRISSRVDNVHIRSWVENTRYGDIFKNSLKMSQMTYT